MRKHPIYGLMAEFATPEELLHAAHTSSKAGYKRMDAFTPLPIEGLSEAVGFHRTLLPVIVLIGGIMGGSTGFGMQYYANVIGFPLNIGGKPYDSWPAFIPITFELTILGAALSAVLGLLALNGLPTPYHPVFNVPEFELASRSHFFLCIKARDPKFDLVKTKEFMESLKARKVSEIQA
ncbi:MAG TPA: DUF3341 domain-containing protein [Terriglobia bacterium]|nr:DUF3341 domain-containing protein [Terriglobia bacterium]